jgi:membrane glycosyltransferase
MLQESPNWKQAATRRTALSRLLSLILISCITGVNYFFFVLYHYPLWVTIPFLVAYFLLGYLGMTYFWSSFFGLYIALKKKDEYNPRRFAKDLGSDSRAAILAPVYHEDARRLGAALGAMWEDLRKHKEANHFDFFILSDSRRIDSVVQEEAITELLQERYPDARFIYRNRRVNSHAKQGNIADFLRRWGSEYKYMLMLDADSIVPGETVIEMARILEGNPRIGIVQGNLSMVFRKTLYARISRYISSLTLKLGLYGQYYTQMGHGYYYGHNAMLRVQPFLEHCGLPVLTTKGPFQPGKPLSHDYVEAALLSGAGYEIWTLPELESYEELPTNFSDDMQREMRWMVGSMMYLRVFLIRRIHSTYKLRLFTSAINYFSPVLGWIFFILALFGLRYIFSHPLVARAVIVKYWFVFVFSLGFLVLSIFVRWLLPTIYYYKNRKLYLFGGFVKSTFTYLLYTIYGLLMGPILMAQLTKMLFFWSRGKKIHWGEQNREDTSLSWSDSWGQYSWMTGLGLCFLWLVWNWVFSLDTPLVQSELGLPKWDLLFWYIPLLGGLIFAPVIARFFSQEHRLVERFGWFISPADIESPFVLDRTISLMNEFQTELPSTYGFADSIADHKFFYNHLHTAPKRPKKEAFWLERLKGKSVLDLSEKERHVVYNAFGLWKFFHEQEHNLTSNTELQ